MTLAVATERKVMAKAGATAWLNAAIACSQDKDRRPLFRTLSVEFFKSGVQFIGCDGTMLFRTWAPYAEGLELPQPDTTKEPEDRVTVVDAEKFAAGFMGTLLAACSDDSPAELTLTIEPVESEQVALGVEVDEFVLTLHALGQQLSCKLFDGAYPNWRALEFGVAPEELVDGMTLAPKLFKAVGKLRGVTGVDCSFRGRTKAIDFQSVHGSVPVCGLLMPMRKPTDRGKSPEDDDAQMEHDG